MGNRPCLRAASIAVVVLALFMQLASAQPLLNLKRVVNNYPTIELYFAAACDGQPHYVFDSQDFKVTESAKEIETFTLWCADPSARCATSTALVFDASGSMLGPRNEGTIAAGNTFVDLMDGVFDEAAVIWFNRYVTVRLGMTSNTTILHNAVDSLPASGGTGVYDGIYVGLQELVNSGNNPCRAVIAMTDGGDATSSHNQYDIIALANKNRIRVFTIGLGGVFPLGMEQIALLTGGKFYDVALATQLEAIYEEIAAIIYAGFLECLITYSTSCRDGSERAVALSLQNFCNGSVTKTGKFTAPLHEFSIHRRGDDLESNEEGAEYQWFLNGAEIPGATSRTYRALQNGNYRVRVTSADGCVLTSLESMVVTSVEEVPTLARKFDIAPNPNSGEFHVDLEFNQPTTFSIRIVDISGKNVYEEAVESQTISFRKQLSVQALSPGVYFMVVQSGERFDRKKFVVQKN
jgi:Secretion system C-terminal sorting domain/von Willebrand factor type A domain